MNNSITNKHNKNIISGLENFTFIDVPVEEIEI